jgi:hypothetical protein
MLGVAGRQGRNTSTRRFLPSNHQQPSPPHPILLRSGEQLGSASFALRQRSRARHHKTPSLPGRSIRTILPVLPVAPLSLPSNSHRSPRFSLPFLRVLFSPRTQSPILDSRASSAETSSSLSLPLPSPPSLGPSFPPSPPPVLHAHAPMDYFFPTDLDVDLPIVLLLSLPLRSPIRTTSKQPRVPCSLPTPPPTPQAGQTKTDELPFLGELKCEEDGRLADKLDVEDRTMMHELMSSPCSREHCCESLFLSFTSS